MEDDCDAALQTGVPVVNRNRRVLMISGFYPSSKAPSSGQKIVEERIAELRLQDVDVTVVAFENAYETRHRVARGSDVNDGYVIFKLQLVARVVGAVLFPNLPLLASARRLLARKRVADLLGRMEYDEIIVEFAQAAEVVPRRWRKYIELVEHDVCWQLYERRYQNATGFRRLLWRLESWRVKRWEATLLKEVGRITVLNQKDKELVQQLSGRGDSGVRYPKLSKYLHGVSRTADKIKPTRIMFWGHMARQENIDAVHWFYNEILPIVCSKILGIEFVIAGADPGPEILALQHRGVIVTGYLEDPKGLFETVGVAVAPLRLGAGIKIKTIETILTGVPTVASPVGAEGVEEHHLLKIAATPAEFAKAVIDCIVGYHA